MPKDGSKKRKQHPRIGQDTLVEEQEVAAEASSGSVVAKKKPKKTEDGCSGQKLKDGDNHCEEDGEGEEMDEDEEEEEEEKEEEEEEEEEDDDEDGEGEDAPVRIFRPGIDKVEEGEQLDVEPGTYEMLHRGQVDWPCLSFDILKDDLGLHRTTFPMTAYVVAGTQAPKAEDNKLYVMKWHRLHKTSKDGASESEDDDSSEDDDDDHEAMLDSKGVPHPGGVNRIRAMPQVKHLVATWADTGKVHMWNIESQLRALDKPGERAAANPKPIYTCESHKTEGFALDWSPHETGRFLSGDNDGAVLLWDPAPGGWSVASNSPFRGHTSSVEDVQWKRAGDGIKSLFASCSADHSVCIWDIREKNRQKPALRIKEAHSCDVNVFAWSPVVGELLATGADDGGFKVWDTRNVDAGPMANFLFHKKPVTSIDWHPTDETMLIVSSDDDCVSIWDMALEDDQVGGELPAGAEHYPPQLLFLHQGLQEPKEVKWHPQLPGVCITTAASGFNIFKTCNL